MLSWAHSSIRKHIRSMPHIIANPWVLRSPPHFIFVNGCAGVLVNGLPCNDALYAPCVEYSDTYSDGARFIHRLHKNENENENSYSCGPAQLKVGQVSYFHTPSPFSPFSFLLLPSSGNGQFRKLLCIFQNSCSLHLPGSPFSASPSPSPSLAQSLRLAPSPHTRKSQSD